MPQTILDARHYSAEEYARLQRLAERLGLASVEALEMQLLRERLDQLPDPETKREGNVIFLESEK